MKKLLILPALAIFFATQAPATHAIYEKKEAPAQFPCSWEYALEHGLYYDDGMCEYGNPLLP